MDGGAISGMRDLQAKHSALISPFDYLFSFSAKRNGRLPRDNANALLGWQYSQIIGIREDL